MLSNKQDSPIDIYIAQSPEKTRPILSKIKSTIHKIVPRATETISYGIPTYDLNGEHLVHFAAFKNHIGFFPTPSAITAFKKDLADYKTSKGTIQFSLDESIPYDLIKRIVKYRVDVISKQKNDNRVVKKHDYNIMTSQKLDPNSPKVTERINATALSLLEKHPEGIHWSELLTMIKSSDPTFHPKTVNGTVWKLVEKFPDLVYKPSKGLFRLFKYK